MRHTAGKPIRQSDRLHWRLLLAGVLWSMFLGATAVVAAIISGVDSMYPTTNTSWSCTSSTAPGNYFCQTDNSSLTFGSESSLTGAQKTFVANVVFAQYDPTDLNASEHTSIVYSGGSETDIVYQTGSLPAGYAGVAWCDDSSPGGKKCDQHYVRMLSSVISATNINSGVTCHETGHAVGLTHGDNASPTVAITDNNLECMKSMPGTTGTLGAHNINQINGTY